MYLIAVLAGTLLVLLYLRVRQKQRYFAERGIPYVEPVFFFGNNWKSLLGRERFSQTIHDVYKQTEGKPFVGVFTFTKPNLLIRDPALIEQITVKSFSHFQDHNMAVDFERNPLQGNLFNLTGDMWRALRTKLSPAFTSSKLKGMFEQMDNCAGSMLQVIDKPGDYEVTDIMARFTTDVIGSCAFGFEPEAINDPDCQFRRMGRKIFAPNFKQTAILALRMAAPGLAKRLGLSSLSKDVAKFFPELMKETFRRRTEDPNLYRNDFVQMLLELKTRGHLQYDTRDSEEVDNLDTKTADKLELTDGLLTAQAFVFFVAGFETTATTMGFTLYLLAKNPKAQEAARNEVRSFKSRYGGKITYEAVKEMTYLDACLKESMRVLPVTELLVRRCNKTCRLEFEGETLVVEEGMTLFIPAYSIHHDPKYYPDPDLFLPERFLNGDDNSSGPSIFMPFGQGPRICIGKRFAVLEAKLGLAKILDSYRLKTSQKMKEPIRINPKTFIPQAADGIWLYFEKIQN